VKQVQAAEVAKRRTAVSSKCFQLYYTCSERLLRIVLPPCPLTVTFQKLVVILRPLYYLTKYPLHLFACMAVRGQLYIYRLELSGPYALVRHLLTYYEVWWWCLSCRWGETMSLKCGHQRAYCSSPRWYEYGEPRWNYTERRIPKNSNQNLFQKHFVRSESHMDWPRREPWPPWWEAGD
jgi:hypothetical protein